MSIIASTLASENFKCQALFLKLYPGGFMEELQHPILRWYNWSMEGVEQLPQGYRFDPRDLPWGFDPRESSCRAWVLVPRSLSYHTGCAQEQGDGSMRFTRERRNHKSGYAGYFAQRGGEAWTIPAWNLDVSLSAKENYCRFLRRAELQEDSADAEVH